MLCTVCAAIVAGLEILSVSAQSSVSLNLTTERDHYTNRNQNIFGIRLRKTATKPKMRSIWIVLGVLAIVLMTTNSVSAEDEVNCVCNRNFMPVCGSDNKTYSNRCVLHCQMDSAQGRSVGLRMVHKGRCGN